VKVWSQSTVLLTFVVLSVSLFSTLWYNIPHLCYWMLMVASLVSSILMMKIYIYIYVYTHIHIRTHTHTRMHTHTHIHNIHTHTRTYIHTYIHTYVHTHMHACMYAYIHMYICTHLHTYVHHHYCLDSFARQFIFLLFVWWAAKLFANFHQHSIYIYMYMYNLNCLKVKLYIINYETGLPLVNHNSCVCSLPLNPPTLAVYLWT